jgi:phage terminase large subunit-like protein
MTSWDPARYQVVVPVPLAHQRRMLESPARGKVVVCGRRWGKTAAGLMAVLRGHGPGRVLRGAIAGGDIWWVGPTFTITTDIWDNLKRATAGGCINKSEALKRVMLPGGGSVTVKSADDPDSLRGKGLDGLVVDEAAFVRPEVWHSSLRPALTDRQGWAMLISTPNGCNWFRDLFYQVQTRAGWEVWQRPTRENPLVLASELDEALLDMGATKFAQEHLAQFVDIEGAEFSSAYFSEDMWFDDWPRLDDFVHRVQTCDPSLGATDRSDYQAHVMMGLDRLGTMWVEADLRRRDRVQIVGDMLDLASFFRPEAVGIESNMWQVLLADQVYEQSRSAGMALPVWSMMNWDKKIVRIRATLTPYLSRSEFRFRRTPGTKLLVDQLRQFPIKGVHDDGPDALEMAVRLMRQVFDSGKNSVSTVEQQGRQPEQDFVQGNHSYSTGVLL